MPEPAAEPAQLALFEPNGSGGSALVSASKLPPLEQVPGLRKVYVRRADVEGLLEACTFTKDQVPA